MRLFFLIVTLLLAAVLTSLHHEALLHYWYWNGDQFDMGMHLLGGFMLGTFAIGLFPQYRPFLFASFILIGSFAWEAFEYAFGISGGRNFFSDTVRDLMMDVLGALVVFLLTRLTLWRSK